MIIIVGAYAEAYCAEALLSDKLCKKCVITVDKKYAVRCEMLCYPEFFRSDLGISLKINYVFEGVIGKSSEIFVKLS